MNYLKSSFILIFLSFIVIDVNAQEAQNNTQNRINKTIDSLIQKTIQINNIPAISIGLIQDGQIINQKGYGSTKRKQGVKVDENTVYQIASLSKMFTSIIARSLIVENKLDLNKSISFYLQDKIDSKTKKKLANIMVRDIFLHRSGIPRNSKTYKRIDGEPMLSEYTETHLLGDLKKIKIRKNGKFKYSNLGYGILGYILESASGLSYEDLLNQYIIQEFNLDNTSNTAQLNTATPYRKDKRNIETKVWNTGKMTPASGIYSSASDLLKMMVKHIAVYSSNSIDLDNSPLNLTNAKDIKNDNNNLYGMGLFKRGSVYGHGGDMDGFASQYWFNSSKGTGVILLTSSGGSWLNELVGEISKVIEEN